MDSLCLQGLQQNAETNCCCCGLAPGRDAMSALHCTEDSIVQTHAGCLCSGGEETCRARYARVNLSYCFVLFHNVIDCCCCSNLRLFYEPTERCAPSSLLLVSRPEPAPAGCRLTTERRAAHRLRAGCEATSLYCCVTI